MTSTQDFKSRRLEYRKGDRYKAEREKSGLITKLTDCEYCGVQHDCILIKRKDQPDRFLEKHGELYICNICLADCIGRDEIRRDEFQNNRPYVFTKDLMSEYKF